jgi:FixJ family two-component response regulator
MGIKAFINKPFDRKELAEIVRRVLDENSRESGD